MASKIATGVFEGWAKGLASYYYENIKVLMDEEALKDQINPPKAVFKSVFTSTTYNLGPQTVCFPHVDSANLVFGWCSVTALGEFDHKKGGHLVLWEAGLVVEFPPGSTILLMSALIHHSNTTLGEGERRYSFTQYSAGQLFQWVENEKMTVKQYEAKYAKDQGKLDEKIARDEKRWTDALRLMPKHGLKVKLKVPTL